MIAGSQLLGDAYVEITAETSRLESAIERAYSTVTSFAHGAGRAIITGIGGALATAAGTALASIWAWAKEEQSVQNLAISIKMLGGDVATLIPRYERFASILQQNTLLSDTATRSAMAYAASLGAPVNQLDKFVEVAAGLSARLGISLETATMLLARAYKSGYFGVFSRYGLSLKETMTVQERWNAIVAFSVLGLKKLNGQADTITGRLSMLKNNFLDIMEALGQKLAEKFKLKEVIDRIRKGLFILGRYFSDMLKQWDTKGKSGWLDKIIPKMISIVASVKAFISVLPRIWNNLKEIMSLETFIKVIKTAADILMEAGRGLVDIITQGIAALAPLWEYLGQKIVNVIFPALDKWLASAHIPLISRAAAERVEARENKFRVLESAREELSAIQGEIEKAKKWGPEIATPEQKAAMIHSMELRAEGLQKNIKALESELGEGNFVETVQKIKKNLQNISTESGIKIAKMLGAALAAAGEKINFADIEKAYNEEYEKEKNKLKNIAAAAGKGGRLTKGKGIEPPALTLGQETVKAGKEVELVGFAEFWRQALARAMQKPKEEEIIKNTKDTAENTKILVQLQRNNAAGGIFEGAVA